ncbi:Myb-like DNA-binding domain-containing protein [Spironucleus salmonicida]|uniref:Myb-like DNA-binding domain-containing protein n=1 Tax=Spironucleus salmonicida TaxID=348837 RepID=V6LJ92_9EUKA|nr:Myb-like DNA-binding domain-containing protein [Spironucleus salmonicida]|eukprot:EST44423.1 Myb-like DNA-binding domain-containing protein [Spironucleus salmonicida]
MPEYHVWTQKEEDAIIQGHSHYYNNYKKIQQNFLQYMTIVQVKNKFYKMKSEGKLAEKQIPSSTSFSMLEELVAILKQFQ